VTLPLYFDHNVHIDIPDGLRQRGIDVLRAFEGLAHTIEDEALLARATALGRALCTSDSDLLRIAAEWQRSGRTFTGVVFVRQLGLDLGRVIEDLELLVRVCSADDVRGRVVFVPL
jgi:hypothetical protein